MRFHDRFTLCICLLACTVQSGSTGVNQMDNAISCQTGQFFTRNTFHCFRTPICTHVREYLCTVCQQMAEEHGYAVAGIIFSSYYVCFTDTVPVKRSIQQSFGVVTIRIKIRPLALSLETGGNGIVSKCLFLESHFAKFRITLYQVAHDKSHLHNKLPIFVFLLTGLGLCGDIEILALIFLAILFCPCHRFSKLFFIIDTFSHATDNFSQVYRFATDAQIFLEEIRIHNRTGNTHGYATHRQIRFSAHGCYCLCGTCKTKQFFCNIGRDGIVIQILHITSVNAKSR